MSVIVVRSCAMIESVLVPLMWGIMKHDWSFKTLGNTVERQRTRTIMVFVATALFYLLATVVATWPLVVNLRTHLPIGTEAPPTVALFNLWTLRWNADRLLAGYAGYWDAPIFFPAQGAFAFSEPQPVTGIVFALLLALVGDHIAAYNLVILLGLTVNGLAVRQLMSVVGLRRGPALLCGLLALALPFTSYELGVVQLLMLFPLALALAALACFAQRRTLGSALLLGGAIALAFFTCEYYGAFALPILGIVSLAWVFRRLDRAAVGNLLIGGAFATIVLWPFLPAQARYTAAFARSDTIIRQNSAQLVDYMRLAPGMLGAQVAPGLHLAGGSGQTLYPGAGLILLALYGVGGGWRAGRRRWVAGCLAGLSVAILISFGLNLTVAGWAPYQLLRILPGWGQLRSPFRMAAVAQLLLVMLAGEGLNALWVWRGQLGRMCARTFTLVIFVEVLLVPAPLYRLPTEQLHAPWVGWLATQPGGAVALVPFPASGAAADYEDTAIGMLQALDHRHPLVNGYSGFFPDVYLELRAAMNDFPNQSSLQALRGANVTYVVIAKGWVTPARQQLLAERPTLLQPLFSDNLAIVYRLENGP